VGKRNKGKVPVNTKDYDDEQLHDIVNDTLTYLQRADKPKNFRRIVDIRKQYIYDLIKRYVERNLLTAQQHVTLKLQMRSSDEDLYLACWCIKSVGDGQKK